MQPQAPPVDLDRTFLVDEHVVDPKRREVRHGDHVASINPKELEVLRELARRPRRVISKEALLDAVWGETVVVEHALTNAVHRLRKAFGDTPRKSRIIRTVHRRGYELIAAVSSVAGSVALGAPSAPAWRPVTDGSLGLPSQPPPVSVWFPAAEPPSSPVVPKVQPARRPAVRGRFLIAALAVVLVLLVPQTSGPSDVTPLPVVLEVIEEASGAVSPADIEGFVLPLVKSASGLVPAVKSGQRKAHVIEVRIRGTEIGVRSGNDHETMTVRTWTQRMFDRLLRLTLERESRTIYYRRMSQTGTISSAVGELLDKGTRAHGRGDLTIADGFFDNALSIDQDDPAALERQAVFHQGQLEVSAAILSAGKSLQNADRRGAASRSGRVRYARTIGDLRQAESLLRDDLSDDPERVVTLYQLLWHVLYRSRDCEQALVLHREIETRRATTEPTIEPLSLPNGYWGVVAIACVMCGDGEGTRESLAAMAATQLLTTDEERVVDADAVATVHAVWATFLALLGDRAGAIEHLDLIPRMRKKGLGGAPDYAGGPYVELQVANAYFLLGDLERAARLFAWVRNRSYPRWSSLATQRLAMVWAVRGDRAKALTLLEGKILDLTDDAPTAKSDLDLADHMLPLRGLVGVVKLLDGDPEGARGELDRLSAIRAARIELNGGPRSDGKRYNAYQEEWLHLLEGLIALDPDGNADLAGRAFEGLAVIKPYADGPFMAFLGWLAATRPALRQAAEAMPFAQAPIHGS